MFKKTIDIKEEKYGISLFDIWKKLNWNNLYSSLGTNEYEWRVLPKYKSLLHLCNLCRGVLWIILFALAVYIEITYEILTYFSSNIILIVLNIIIIFFPIIIMELLILFRAPLEIKSIESTRAK